MAFQFIRMFRVIKFKHLAHCCTYITRTCFPWVAFSVNELCEYFFEATIKLTPTPWSCDCQSDMNLKESYITQTKHIVISGIPFTYNVNNLSVKTHDDIRVCPWFSGWNKFCPVPLWKCICTVPLCKCTVQKICANVGQTKCCKQSRANVNLIHQSWYH